MSTIFILGLEDSYTKEQLYQLKPVGGKTTVSFERLVDAASEIAVAKDNFAEASGTLSVCAMSAGDQTKTNATCGFCASKSQNENGYTEDVCRKFCRAFGKHVTSVRKLIIFRQLVSLIRLRSGGRTIQNRKRL